MKRFRDNWQHDYTTRWHREERRERWEHAVESLAIIFCYAVAIGGSIALFFYLSN